MSKIFKNFQLQKVNNVSTVFEIMCIVYVYLCLSIYKFFVFSSVISRVSPVHIVLNVYFFKRCHLYVCTVEHAQLPLNQVLRGPLDL